MKRLSAIALLTLAVVLPAAAQRDLLKPFRPDGNKPADKPAPADPKPADPKPEQKSDAKTEPKAAEPKATEAKPGGDAPLKPFRPGEEPAKALPVKPKAPEEDPAAPKAKPVKRPVEPAAEVKPPPTPAPAAPAVAPTETPPPVSVAGTPEAEVPKAKPIPPRAAPPEVTEPGDIVIKPGTPATAPDMVQLQYADNAYARKLWREAAPEYERFLERFPRAAAPDRQAAYYRLAECYRQTDALNAAKRNYEAVLNNFANGEFLGYAAYRLGGILYEEKDYRGALSVYRRASVRNTQPALIHSSQFFIARCLEATGQKTEARVQYEDLAKVVDNNPYRDASRLSAGRLLEEGRRPGEALKWLEPLSKDSTNPEIRADALKRTGQLQVELGQFDTAIKTLTDALALPELGVWKNELHVAVFRALSEKKDYKAVIERYESGVSKDLSQEAKLNILIYVAGAQRELNQNDAALALYDQIARDFPGLPQARDAAYERLILLYNAGDARLLDELNRFLNDFPTAPQVERVSLMKAEALFKAGDYKNAAPIYEVIVSKARGLSGNFLGEAMSKLGSCRMELREYEKAVTVFNQFLEKFRQHAKVTRVLAELGTALKELKRYPAALKIFEELTTKYPKAPEREFGLENLALICGQLGDSDRMAATFEILLRDYPATTAKAKAHYWIGSVNFQHKDYKKAVPHLIEARGADAEQFFERTYLPLLGCYYGLEDLDAAEKLIDEYEKTTKKSVADRAKVPAVIRRWLGQKNFERGMYDRAIPHLEGLITGKESSPEDVLLLARAEVRLRKIKEGVAHYDTYLTLVKDPGLRMSVILEKLDAQIAQKDWDGAEKTDKDALASAPEGKFNGELRLRGGEIEYGKANKKKALQVFEAIPLTLDDDDICPRALQRAIEIHRELGNETEAKRLENQLRSKYPEFLQKKNKLAKP